MILAREAAYEYPVYQYVNIFTVIELYSTRTFPYEFYFFQRDLVLGNLAFVSTSFQIVCFVNHDNLNWKNFLEIPECL